MTPPHSPLPWRSMPWRSYADNSSGIIIIASDGVTVARCKAADAAIIVTAVNNYEKMRKALEVAEELLREDLQSLVDGHTVLYPPDPDYGKLDAEGREAVAPYEAALALIRAALAGEGEG